MPHAESTSACFALPTPPPKTKVVMCDSTYGYLLHANLLSTPARFFCRTLPLRVEFLEIALHISLQPIASLRNRCLHAGRLSLSFTARLVLYRRQNSACASEVHIGFSSHYFPPQHRTQWHTTIPRPTLNSGLLILALSGASTSPSASKTPFSQSYQPQSSCSPPEDEQYGSRKAQTKSLTPSADPSSSCCSLRLRQSSSRSCSPEPPINQPQLQPPHSTLQQH